MRERMLLIGGMDLNTAGAFIEAGSRSVAGGGNLVNEEITQPGEFGKLTAIARKYVEIVAQAREAK
jgi:2-keto-3-deoxy-6-phosphogluconate aldolase